MLGSLLERDTFYVSRPVGGTDEEGAPNCAWTTPELARGTWGSPTTRDQDEAQRLGQTLDAVVATRWKLQVGWKIEDLRGENYIITHVRPLVPHRRVFLKRHG